VRRSSHQFLPEWWTSRLTHVAAGACRHNQDGTDAGEITWGELHASK